MGIFRLDGKRVAVTGAAKWDWLRYSSPVRTRRGRSYPARSERGQGTRGCCCHRLRDFEKRGVNCAGCFGGEEYRNCLWADRRKRQIPLEGRMTTAAEIAAAVVFLLSPTQSGHTTAQHIIVDGGYVHLNRMLTAKRVELNPHLVHNTSQCSMQG